MNIKLGIFDKCIKESLKNFKEKKCFSFVGLAGSLNIHNDLDLIVTPINKIKRGKFLIILLEFLRILKKKLIKNKCDLICFGHFCMQEEVEYISKRNENDFLIHLISFNQFNMGKNNEVSKGFLKNIRKIYYGDKINLERIKEKKLDLYYSQLLFANLFFSRYPKELLKKKINKRMRYISKHINITLKLNEDPLNDYINCCKSLDKISKK